MPGRGLSGCSILVVEEELSMSSSTSATAGPPEHLLAASCACSKRSLSPPCEMRPLSMSTLTSTAQMPTRHSDA